MARDAIPKKVRFEVFKRDSFKCQYCGRSAPEVVLHVDHIRPVKENGENDIMNYITACQDCNLGKGARKLDDSSEIEKQKKELDLLQKRREQLEMMMLWRESLQTLTNQEVDILNKSINEIHGYSLTDKGKTEIAKLIKRFSFKEVLDAIEGIDKYHPEDGIGFIKYLVVICKMKREEIEKPYLPDLYYIRGILRNRLNNYDRIKYYIIPFLEEVYQDGFSIEQISCKAKEDDSWSDFQSSFGR